LLKAIYKKSFVRECKVFFKAAILCTVDMNI
jgi:hypothetical protein